MLAVMTSRLGRIIDRARYLEEQLVDVSPEFISTLQIDLKLLSQRAKLIYLAIALCTTTALLVCAVIAFLFVSAYLQFDASVVVALLFIAAMSTFVFGLLWFLREIYVGTISLRIGPR